ncbi:unnamed protein product [Paramecium primaurelia]|uniref:Uncharacterized protein n=1 Tax=Paramecium primaurelia TaxID=5886 RepID=A0A8S1LEQ6_PARPR|nr:unnamed protein product [Paramecium primaurelia]
MSSQNKQLLFFNGQQIEILEKINEIGKIKLYSGILKTLEKNILLIEINLNFQHKHQISLFVNDQDHYEYYKEKLQYTFLKTQNDCIFQLDQHQIYFWNQYFQQQEFKLLPFEQKERLFYKYCRQKIKQKTYDLCLFSKDHLGNIQFKGINQQLFIDNNFNNQLHPYTTQEQMQLDIQQVKDFGNLYFQILTDIDYQQLNQMTLEQSIYLILNSPLYEWQKQEIINLINPLFVQELTKQHLLNLLKENHYDMKNYFNQQSNQQIEIIYQYTLEQQQIQSQLNYLYYHINQNNEVIYQEYQYLKKINTQFQKFINTSLIQQTFSNEIQDIFKQQLNELNRLSYQFNFNLKKTLCENLILKHNKLQKKLDTFYQPTQFLGQFGTLQIILFSKLQHQNKMILQNLELQSNSKNFNDVLSILQFNQSYNKLNQISQDIKLEFKSYQSQLVNQLLQIKQLLESNLKRIQTKLQGVNLQYLMMVATEDESDQTSFIPTILERQQFLNKIILDIKNENPDVIDKQNSNKVDILSTSQKYQELEYKIRNLNEVLEEQQLEVLQLEEKLKMRILNFVNELRQKIQQQLELLKYEFNSQFQSIKLFLINFSKNQNLINNQEFIQSENRIQQIIQNQIYRFSLIEELLQQYNQTKKQYFHSISKKIEKERIYIQKLVNQELKLLNEILNKSYDSQDNQLKQEILEFEFIILKTQYSNVINQLEQEIQNIKQKFTSLEVAFQEQLLLLNKIEILCQENKELINHYKYINQKLDHLLRKINDKFEENKKRFYQFFNFLQDTKVKINVQQDQERLCLEIKQKIIEIQQYFEIIQNQNIEKSKEDKRIEYQKLRNMIELIQKEIIIKGNQTDFNSTGYYQQLTLIILSKFYHLSRFYQRLMQSNVLNNNQSIQIQDLELINSYKDMYAYLETQVDYYKKLVIENGGQINQKSWKSKLNRRQIIYQKQFNATFSSIQINHFLQQKRLIKYRNLLITLNFLISYQFN